MRINQNEDEEWLMSLVQILFARRITKVAPSSRASFPSFVLFDGTTDLKDHIVMYHDTMMTFRILGDKLEAMICKIISTSLTGAALSWYHSLQLGSIWSFNELAMSFKA